MVDFLAKLVRCRSLTPDDDGAIGLCADFLSSLGFHCEVLSFQGIKNLYARLGKSNSIKLCFAGHVDVVPPLEGWHSDPFETTIKDGRVYGRGTNDMKGPLSACFSAISDCIKSCPSGFSLGVILTSDEEKMGDFGTKSVVNLLKDRGEKIDLCILCESCSIYGAVEYIKIGCRGSLNVDLFSTGSQCHVARAREVGNHLHKFVEMLDKLCNSPLDDGSSNFEPSSIQLTSLESSRNSVRNIVPPYAEALLNIRFNDNWTFATLEKYIAEKAKGFGVKFERFGTPFIGCSMETAQKLQKIVQKATGKEPQIGAQGGNSDALSLREIAEVVEIGSSLSEAHIIDEHISLRDLELLKKVYVSLIQELASLE